MLSPRHHLDEMRHWKVDVLVVTHTSKTNAMSVARMTMREVAGMAQAAVAKKDLSTVHSTIGM
jgi:hypothetical protein